MSFQRSVEGQFDYSVCHYGRSKLNFRGPQQDIGDDYIAFLGGTETFGKFVAAPFPDLVGEVVGRQSVNLGCVNAGLDTFLTDETVRDYCQGASACALQVMGAHMLTNRLYSVHARRNDRFLMAKPELQALFPDADFADVHFARHLISTLAEVSAEGLEALRQELTTLWVWRMRQILGLVRGPVVLVWISARSPDEGGQDPHAEDPLFIDRSMLEVLRPDVAGIVEVKTGGDQRRRSSGNGAIPLVDLAAARELPSPAVHFRIAAEVSEVLSKVL